MQLTSEVKLSNYRVDIMGMGPMEFSEAVKIIKNSGYFDENWYLQSYPDVARLGMDPVEHFVLLGATLLRNPNSTFSTKSYIEQVGLSKSGLENALLHFIDAQKSATNGRSVDESSGLGFSGLSTEECGEDKYDLILYSCLFGNYEQVKEPTVKAPPGVKFLLFTDRTDITSEIWEVVVVGEGGPDLRRNSRMPKMMPALYLPPHRYSIYIDSSLEWSVTPSIELVEEILSGRDIALYRHFERSCTYEELKACADKGKAKKSEVDLIAKRFSKEGFPVNYGLYENGFIARRNTKAIQFLDIMWWKEYCHGPHRDQFYLMYLLWKYKIESTMIPDAGNFRYSKYIRYTRHPSYKKTPGSMRITWMLAGEANSDWAYANNTARFIKALKYDGHRVNEVVDSTDVAVFFDALLYERTDKRGRTNVLRLGGPRPLRRLFEGRVADRNKFLKQFDALIALSPELETVGRLSGVPTYLVPNGLDLDVWQPCYKNGGDFVVGFAGNIQTGEERLLKGYDKVVQACKNSKVQLLSATRKDGRQSLSHEDMRQNFFSKISCLVHPVAEGKEGSSNVIMEALACGVPVITTRASGFHGQMLKNENNVLFVDRSLDSITKALTKLKSRPELQSKLSKNGRKFAEYFHDLRNVAQEYRNIFQSTLRGRDRIRVSFQPVRAPFDTTATGRLRCGYVVEILQKYLGSVVRADIGPLDHSDVIVVSQLCSEGDLIRLQELSARGVIIIYDCCDPYYDRAEEVYGVNAKQRFWELHEVASRLTVPTENMRKRMIAAGVVKPISVIPDSIDYREQRNAELVKVKKSVVWFGNKGHGNLTSGLWALRYLKDELGFDVTLITDPDGSMSDWGFNIVKWKLDGFVTCIKDHGLVLLSQEGDASYKSENRLVSALANGVPAISIGSATSAQLLEEIGYSELVVSNEGELASAVARLSDEAVRKDYIDKAQAVIWAKYEGLQIARKYFEDIFFPIM